MKPESMNVILGDCYIRFRLSDDENLGFNKLYHIFEIGDVIPTARWRRIIRSRSGFSPVLLQKRACFLPAFSCTLDRILTFVYWGEKQFVFQPDYLQKLRLRNLLIRAGNPSSILISAANLAWPKSIGAVYTTQISTLAYIKNYIFNALPAPDSRARFFGWNESPFLIIGDRSVEIFVISKTIGSISPRKIKSIGNEWYVGTAYLIDNRLATFRIRCFFDSQTLLMFKKYNVMPVLAVKNVRVFDKESGKRPTFKVTIYPIDVTYLFENSAIPGVFLTALSLVLRYLYSTSKDPLVVANDLEKCHSLLLNLLRESVFRNFKASSISSKLVQDLNGLKVMISALGTYLVKHNSIVYKHPSIFESVISSFGDSGELFERKKITVNSLIDIALKIFKMGKEMLQFASLIQLKDEIETKLGLHVSDYGKIENFVRSIILLKQEIIPFSKFLNWPRIS